MLPNIVHNPNGNKYEISKLFSAVNNINFINSSITFQGKLETLLRKLANLAIPALDQNSLPLADSIRYGLSVMLFGTTQLVTFVNVTKTTTIPADFLFISILS